MVWRGLGLLAAVLLTGAMGEGRQHAAPPVVLPGDAAVPGAGLNRPATRDDTAQAAPQAAVAAQLRVLPADEVDPAAFLWQARVVAVFADTAADPSFVRQLQSLADADPLLARDVVVVTDTDPAARSAWRRQFRPEGFSLVLIDKDGQVKARKPLPWTAREIARAIDKFPTWREEIGRLPPAR